ncbi:MAG: hypothetical protein OER97_07535, partial [Gammaproteobacteria bacterium]|nr:hypothetical protein [Gammaproteobacteria bacterium]
TTAKALTNNVDEDGSLDVSAGDTLTYTITVTNTGTANLTNVTVVDSLTGANTSCALVTPGNTCVLMTNYQVTVADVLAGMINNIGTGDTDQTPPSDSPVNVPVPNPSLAVDKQVISITNPDLSNGGASVDQAGDKITYDIVVTNNGTANLTNVTVDDDLTGTVDTLCSAFLAPTLSCTVTVMYTATLADLDNNGTNPTLNGFIDNTATGDSVQTDPLSDSEQVPVIQSPAHTLTKTFDEDDVGVGEMGTFTLVYTNTGNVTLSDIDITDAVDPRLVVDSVTPSVGSCTNLDNDNDDQTILCEVGSLAPGNSVTVTVTFVALDEELVADNGETSGANYVFYFDNGYVLYGSTETGEATLEDENRVEVPAEEWSVVGANQDIFFNVPYAGGDDGGFQLHLSCSEAFIDGWGATGPIEGVDDPDWNVIAYEVLRFNVNGLFKDCTQTFPFDVENTASAEATPAGGTLAPNPIDASDSVHVINIAPIEVSRDRVRRGDVEIQYFNTSFEDLEIEIIRVEWDDQAVMLESASYQDGVDLGISGCDPTMDNTCILQASIFPATVLDARSKDWLKLSFDSGDAPDGLTVTIVTSTGATFTYVYVP